MRYLIKMGSALISKENTIDLHWLSKKIQEISRLHRRGDEIIIVSSGAVAAGMETRGLAKRPQDTLQLQLLAGQGQVKLTKYFKDLFMEKQIYIAQILLTHHNFVNRREVSTIRAILEAYVRDGVVPVINENDMINKEELDYQRSFTDNDILAGLVAKNLPVDCAVILTDVDGLFQGDPKAGNHTRVIPEIPEITDDIRHMASRGKSDLGLGGMASKIQAAEIVTSAGIDTIVANGRRPLPAILDGTAPRTLFHGCR